MARHLKDASGAATATGLRPVLDLPGHKPQTGSYPEMGDAQSRTPAHPPNPAIHVLDTAPLLMSVTGSVIRQTRYLVAAGR